MPPSKAILDQIALTKQEYRIIEKKLGREPNDLELGMFGALWSEHCGYKHSKPLLKFLPSFGSQVKVPAGQENAGVIDIGDGMAIVMKIESHNHPSAVEPYEGAATGVGGIVRDIFAMGARPIALLNSLRFGPLCEPRNRYLLRQVVGGISGYGNCIGVPDVGGETTFGTSYRSNPLVNAMCVGLLKTDSMIRSKATGVGNLLMLAGAETGRDGIHGASGLASRTFEGERELRPTVQVGNPFLEKLLIEACLEAAQTGLLEGMQDLGAAGLTSSVIESAYKGGRGVELDVARVPRREDSMTPYEVMLSESQERMLLIVKPDHQEEVSEVFQRWNVPCSVIGRVTQRKSARVYEGGKLLMEVPVQVLAEAPQYRLKGVKSRELAKLQAFPLEDLALPKSSPEKVLLQLLASPNIASKKWLYRQYDHQVQTRTVVSPGDADAAVLRISGSQKGIALCADGNGRRCYLDPYYGGAHAVAEACRNLICTGARPLAVTDCLNFGNPERPEVYFQLEQCIRGMAAACDALEVPIVSGNVSLYNETRGESIYPSPVVGALGLLENVERHCTAAFKFEGDTAILIGAGEIDASTETLAGSEYLELVHDLVVGQPKIDMEAEMRLHRCVLQLIENEILNSAHDCSDGGLAVTLAESCILGNKGVETPLLARGRWDTALYGEAPSRLVASLSPSRISELDQIAKEHNVPWITLGVISGNRFRLSGLMDIPVEKLAQEWSSGLERSLDS